jgi:uncharacterized protein (DUF1778 family)
MLNYEYWMTGGIECPMERSTKAKETRIELRVTVEQKNLLEKAASLKGLSLSAYLLSHTLAAAREDITAGEKLILSERDWDLFVSMLENPPEPETALSSAIEKFREKYEK